MHFEQQRQPGQKSESRDWLTTPLESIESAYFLFHGILRDMRSDAIKRKKSGYTCASKTAHASLVSNKIVGNLKWGSYDGELCDATAHATC